MDNASPQTSNAVAISRQPSSIATLTAELKPVGPTAIKPLLAKLSLACRSSQGDEIDWKARATLYIEHLSDLPARYLAEAIHEWINTNVFFPAIAELRVLANRKAEAARRKLKDLRDAQAKAEEERRYANMKRPTPEQMKEIRERIERIGR